jgi:hypothetical protein
VVTHITNEAWWINPSKIQGIAQIINFSGITWTGSVLTFSENYKLAAVVVYIEN